MTGIIRFAAFSAALIALLVFVYIVANITIFGAEIASELAKDRVTRRTKGS